MKKIIIFGLALILISCNKQEKVEPTVDSLIDSALNIDDSTTKHINLINLELEKSNILEKNIKNNIVNVTELKKQNITLKTELKATKDSILELKKELIEVKNKLPKKKNFIQKLLNIVPDSIEVITYDTVVVN